MAHQILRRLAATLAAATAAVAVSTAATSPAPASAITGTRYIDLVFPTTTLQSDVVYATAPDLVSGATTNLLLDVYQPAGDGFTARPVIVAIHGGGFKGGSKAAVADWSSQWARRGYVVVNINYRLDPGNQCQNVQDGKIPPDQLAAETARCTRAVEAAQFDASAAIRWVRANADTYRVDSTRIAAMGSSAGAVTALHLAYRSDTPGDIGDYDGYDSTVGAAMAMSGCNYSPEAIGAGDAPVAMIHAEYDGAVPFQCAISTAAIARSKGLTAETMLWYGEGTHAQALYKKYQTTIDPVWTQFLIRHLNLRYLVAAGSKSEIHGEPNRSAIVSLTAVSSDGPGYLQALPCDATPGGTSNLNTDGAGQTRAGLAVVQFDATGTACVYNSMNTHVLVDLQGYLAADTFDDVTDVRLTDTRSGAAVLHGDANRSAVISLTATRTLGGGWLQALPCDATPGSTSNLNTDAVGQTRAALAIVPFDADGEVCVYNSFATHLVVDLQGYFADGSFDDVDDDRLADTRSGSRVGAGSTTIIHGTPNSSAFLSVVSTMSIGRGWLQVLPCDEVAGMTSNLNVDRAGLTIAGAAVARFDADGEACVYSSVSTHLIVDLQGYFTPGSFDDVDDDRLLDTRPV
ncbi:MAG: alpha/beta hydrolase [Ilumatobacteraceae bacterium]